MNTITRRSFVKRSGAVGGGLIAAGPLGALASRAAGQASSEGYGPLVDKGEIWLPAEFDYQVISRQGDRMSDGQPTPGIFDGMGAYPGPNGTTILIRNHENRERAGEQKVITSPSLEYNPAAAGGNTKLRVRRKGTNYEVVEAFGILGGTSTNCAGGLRSPAHLDHVRGGRQAPGRQEARLHLRDRRARRRPRPRGPGAAGRPARARGGDRAGRDHLHDRGPQPPVRHRARARSARACTATGRIGPAAADRSLRPQVRSRRSRSWASSTRTWTLGARSASRTRSNGSRCPSPTTRTTPTTAATACPASRRIVSRRRTTARPTSTARRACGRARNGAKIYFDCTSGGPQDLGQVWEYDPGRETITLIYESSDAARLENPDNVVIVPADR